MIKRQTLENYVKYCKDLILSIKTRQRVEGSRTKVINNYGAGAGSNWDIAIPIDTIYTDLANYPAKRIKIRFTPNNSLRPLTRLDYDYSYTDLDAPIFKIKLSSTATIATNYLEWVIQTPFLDLRGTLYFKANARSVDSGLLTYIIEDITTY